jgi:hypothetical protein
MRVSAGTGPGKEEFQLGMTYEIHPEIHGISLLNIPIYPNNGLCLFM